jgi:hypothetical protein
MKRLKTCGRDFNPYPNSHNTNCGSKLSGIITKHEEIIA